MTTNCEVPQGPGLFVTDKIQNKQKRLETCFCLDKLTRHELRYSTVQNISVYLPCYIESEDTEFRMIPTPTVHTSNQNNLLNKQTLKSSWPCSFDLTARKVFKGLTSNKAFERIWVNMVYTTFCLMFQIKTRHEQASRSLWQKLYQLSLQINPGLREP